MLIRTFLLGFGLLLLGFSPSKNVDGKYTLLSKNNYTPVSNFNKENSAREDLQESGKELYADFCMQCHGANGKGDGKNFPPLDGSDWLKLKRTQSIYAIKYGQSGAIVVNKIKYNNVMPAMELSDQEVADVMNYIMNSWGNKQSKKVTKEEVEKIKK